MRREQRLEAWQLPEPESPVLGWMPARSGSGPESALSAGNDAPDNADDTDDTNNADNRRRANDSRSSVGRRRRHGGQQEEGQLRQLRECGRRNGGQPGKPERAAAVHRPQRSLARVDGCRSARRRAGPQGSLRKLGLAANQKPRGARIRPGPSMPSWSRRPRRRWRPPPRTSPSRPACSEARGTRRPPPSWRSPRRRGRRPAGGRRCQG
jgi:hypothetical protein